MRAPNFLCCTRGVIKAQPPSLHPLYFLHFLYSQNNLEKSFHKAFFGLAAPCPQSANKKCVQMADHDASPPDYLAVAKFLVEAKADLHAKDNAGQTPFHVACAAGNSDMAKFLFEASSDPNVVDNQGTTPLHAAIKNDHAELRAYLLAILGRKSGVRSEEDPKALESVAEAAAVLESPEPSA